MKHKSIDFDVKSVDETGIFTGYGSIFGNVDGGNEIVVKGAFAKSLKERAEKGRKLPILWQHKSSAPIGVFESVEEDDQGLKMTGRLLIADVQQAKEAYALMKAGAVTGMSIGYNVLSDAVDQKSKTRSLIELDLMETSVVTFPMNDAARVELVKSVSDESASKAIRWLKKAIKLHEGHMDGSVPPTDSSQKEMMDQMEKALSYLSDDSGAPMAPMKGTIREFEELLREKGFSRSDAEHIAVHGFKNWQARECEAAKTSDWLTDLKGFSLQ